LPISWRTCAAPTPSAAAELVVAAKMEFSSRIDRLRDRLGAGARGHLQRLSRRIHVAAGRPAFAGFPTRLAMRGRHAAELSHVLARLMRAGIAVRERRCQQLDRQLGTFDLGRRLEGIRTRLVGADGRLSAAARRRQHRAGAQLGHVAGRLDALNPLAVLGSRVRRCVERGQVARPAGRLVGHAGRHRQGHAGQWRVGLRGTLHRGIDTMDTTDTKVNTQPRAMSDTSIKDFEAAIAELESIVKKLEEGELPLEQSLELYERGMKLSRFCHSRLEEAERRIEILNERGELKTAPASLGSDAPER
jgi:exodeoxyribonuclease VII small subunit